MAATESELTEHRFAHLLKPIRDLAENWNIDVASELEEYLQTLEELDIVFDQESNKSLNFAEAALLLQGSACVYSKKVEFLYGLIYQCLDIVAKNSKRIQKKSSINDDGLDCDAVVQAQADFLTLDDHLKEAKNIDLANTPYADYKKLRQGSLISRTPLSALNVKSIQKTGNEDSNDYKISECAIHPSGALLFEERDSRLVDLSFRRDTASANILPFGSPASLLKSNAKDAKVNEERKDDGIVKELDFPQHETNPFDDGCSSDGGDGGGEVGGWDVNNGDNASNGNFADGESIDQEEGEDMWVKLDPYAIASDVQMKPFKKGKNWRKPRRKNYEGDRVFAKAHKLVVDSFSKFRQPAETLECMTQPTHVEFIPYFVQHLKRKHATKKSRKASNQTSSRREKNLIDNYQKPQDPVDCDGGCSSSEEFDIAEAVQDPLEVPEQDFKDQNHLEGDEIFGNAAANTAGDAFNIGEQPQLDASATFEELCKKHIENYVHAAQKYMIHTNLSKRVSSWRSKIEPVLKEMDSRPEFDIHKYGDNVISKVQTELKDIERKVPLNFGAIVQGKPKYEICRVFLATLQLANHLKVDINPSEECDHESLQIVLLDTAPAAPSIMREDSGVGSFGDEKRSYVVEVKHSPGPKKKRMNLGKPELKGGNANAEFIKKGKPQARRRRGLGVRSVNALA